MRFIGLDVHKSFVEVCVLNPAGKRLFRGRVDCTREALDQFARERLRPEDQFALEATTNSWAVVDLLRPHVGRIVVSNPLRTKAIAEAKIKTDKVDAEVLAQLLRCDYLPEVWQPDAATRQLRKLTTARTSLVADRTRIKNRAQSLLADLLIAPPMSVLFCKSGIAWLRQLDLPEDDRLLVEADLRLLEEIERELSVLDDKLAKLAYAEDQVRLLMTLPGFGSAVAQGLLAARGDVRRFRDGDHATSYLGLVPSTRQSAGHCYHGPITKAGRSHARWLLTQAAEHLADHPGPRRTAAIKQEDHRRERFGKPRHVHL